MLFRGEGRLWGSPVVGVMMVGNRIRAVARPGQGASQFGFGVLLKGTIRAAFWSACLLSTHFSRPRQTVLAEKHKGLGPTQADEGRLTHSSPAPSLVLASINFLYNICHLVSAKLWTRFTVISMWEV